MTKFIPVNCIRDFSLSAGIMQHIPRIIEIENSTHGCNLLQYIDVAKDGIVTRCAMIIVEGTCASVVFSHDLALLDSEALVRSELPEVTHIQCFSVNAIDRPAGWKLASANFKTRISTPTKNYRFEDTDHPSIKLCHLSIGKILCSVVGNIICVALSEEAVDRTIQQSVDMLAGVAVSEGKLFAVQCMSDKWAQAYDGNPNYIFNNAMVVKALD